MLKIFKKKKPVNDFRHYILRARNNNSGKYFDGYICPRSGFFIAKPTGYDNIPQPYDPIGFSGFTKIYEDGMD